MKVLRNSNKTVLIASGERGNCPRAIVLNAHAKFADDYHGKIKGRKSIVSKLFNV